MQPLDSIERRMAALFLLLMILIVWQAVRTHPLQSFPLVMVLEPGEQVFPVAVPPEGAPRLPAAPAERLAFLEAHAVKGFAAIPADACEGFVRISAHHWLRVPIARERGGQALYLAGTGWLTDPGQGDPLARAELRTSGPGAEVEVFCAP
jgi:hypothetical protein